MKNTYLVLLTILLVGQSVSAQLYFGPMAGLSLSNGSVSVAGNTRETTNAKEGSFGIDVEYKLRPEVYLWSALLYSHHGYGVVGEWGTFHSHSAELPIYVQCKSSGVRAPGFLVGAGVFTGYVLKKNDFSVFERYVQHTGKHVTMPDVVPFRCGVGVQMGVHVSSSIFLRGIYQYGLTNVYAKSEYDIKYHPHQFTICAGYLFKKSPKKKNKDSAIQKHS